LAQTYFPLIRTHEVGTTLFAGTIKNISELKVLLKQLNTLKND